MSDDTPELIRAIESAGMTVYRKMGNGEYHIEVGNYVLASVEFDGTGQGGITAYQGASYQSHPRTPELLALYAIAIRKRVPFTLEDNHKNTIYKDNNQLK